MRRRGVPIAIVCALALALAACSFRFETKVTGSLDEKIAFEFFYEGRSVSDLHVSGIEVTEVFADHEEPIWFVHGSVQRDRVWFGLEPVGMSGGEPSRPLRPGGTYRVSVQAALIGLTFSGPGSSMAGFRIRADGRPEPVTLPLQSLPRRCSPGTAPSPDAGPVPWLGTVCR